MTVGKNVQLFTGNFPTPNEWKTLDWDENPQTNKQTNKQT